MAALDGVETLFLVSAAEARRPARAAPDLRPGRGRRRGRHVVYTSFSGAAPDATFTLGRDHFDTEQAIRAAGLAFTFLRDNFYLDLLPYFADEHGVIRGPAGEGRVAGVARADVARRGRGRAARPGRPRRRDVRPHRARGADHAEIAARAGAVLGRELRFEHETIEEAYASRRAAYDAEQWQLDAWVSTYTAIAEGALAAVSDDVAPGDRPRAPHAWSRRSGLSQAVRWCT